MGCAFSHTAQIFIIDHRNDTLQRANIGMGILGHVRRALAHSPQMHITTHWLLASKKIDNDIVVVGHLKSNGLRRRQRRGSEDVRFIEHRAKIRVSEEGKEEWGPKMPKSPSMTSSDKLRKLSKSQERHTSNSHFGLVDFRKRLERVRRFDRTEGDEEVPKTEEQQKKDNGKNAKGQKEVAKGCQQEPMEAMIIKHRTTLDEEEGGLEDELFCDWDTLSAECCSIQMSPFHCRTPAAGDGSSEASFVLVKKRLKVAWEHHQIVQVRRQSLTRRADPNNGNNLANNSPMKNTWMPDIAQEDSFD